MQRWRHLVALSSVGALVSACLSSPLPPESSVPGATASITPAAPSPTAVIAAASPGPVAGVTVFPEVPVVYAGETATLSVLASGVAAKTAPNGHPLIVSHVALDFGDGTTGSIDPDCQSAPWISTVHHVYTAAGRYQVAVLSATLCEPGWQLNLDTSERIRVLPAATPESTDWPACTTYQLRMTGTGLGGSLGNAGALFRLQNVSTTGCTLVGYPGLQLVGPSRALLPTHVHDASEGDYLFPTIAVGSVSLAPREFAAFQMGYGDNPSGSAANEPHDVACPIAHWVRIILPQVHQYGTAEVSVSPCEGVVNVSPIFPGRDWIGFD